MIIHLPFGNFQLLDPKIFTEETIKNINKEVEQGYVFEVDTDYPKHLHEKHSELPFCSERKKIK